MSRELTKDEVLKIADIHYLRISEAIDHINFEITKETITKLTHEQLTIIDSLILRFGQLQDLIGSKLIDLFFKEKLEDYLKLSMKDKLNRLERLEIIDNSDIWIDMRNARNLGSHEYPDNPELMAKYINDVLNFAPVLLQIYNKLKTSLEKS